jgi:hypothetical protein
LLRAASKAAEDKPAADFRTAASWLKSPIVNGLAPGGFCLPAPTKLLRKRRKSRFRREKCTSEILVYGFIVARVNQEPQSLLAPARLRNRFRMRAVAEIPKENQYHSPA